MIEEIVEFFIECIVEGSIEIIHLFAKKYRENRRRKQPEEKSDKC